MPKSKIKYRLITAFCVAMLCGCSASDKSSENAAVLTPLSETQLTVNYDDGYLKNAMRDYLQYHNAPLFSQYDFTKKDLDEDGILDALVYLKTPYGHWCNASGCTLLIFKGHPEGFSVVGDIRAIRPPFDISREETNGWKDIKVHISGKSEKAHTLMLFFNGEQYAQSHIVEPYMNRNYVAEKGISP